MSKVELLLDCHHQIDSLKNENKQLRDELELVESELTERWKDINQARARLDRIEAAFFLCGASVAFLTNTRGLFIIGDGGLLEEDCLRIPEDQWIEARTVFELQGFGGLREWAKTKRRRI